MNCSVPPCGARVWPSALCIQQPSSPVAKWFVGVLSWKHAFTSLAAFPGAGGVVGVGLCEDGPHPGAAGAHITSLEQKSLRLGGFGSDAPITLISQEIERMGAVSPGSRGPRPRDAVHCVHRTEAQCTVWVGLSLPTLSTFRGGG